MAEKKQSDKINDALLKVALGYQVAEVTEEYAEVDGALKLTKRKKTKKDVPPDLKAVQLLLAENGGEEYSAWSDEDLEAERKKLLKALSKGLDENEKTSGLVKKKSVTKKRVVKKKTEGAKALSTKKKTGTKRAVKKEDKE